jgi:hypothetical protein
VPFLPFIDLMEDNASFDELNDLLVFGERLRLLASLQATYLDELRGHGFDEDQSFTLVRDWSQRAFDWTVRYVPTPASLDHELIGVDSGSGEDPSTAPADGPYLLPFDDQDEQAA